ncbi:hypothetical protein RvY_18492 [Ramazzottius varieornatus]|uniref:Gamma-glutamyltransferase n=1 Tax=Ramazzottius varieornatus TaxID=947166 RepID=A0A1D1W5Y9_RAMVA|nr:hypothetical protein RvY_18492 [Ramazzottius varieornatus]
MEYSKERHKSFTYGPLPVRPFVLDLKELNDDRTSLSKWRIFGTLSVISLAILLVLAMSTSSSSGMGLGLLWLGGPSLLVQNPASTTLTSGQPEITAVLSNSSTDYETMSEKLVPGWPTPSTVRTYQQQAVASDVAVCSVIGNEMLKANGTAADAVIAAALCSGVVHPYSSGLGGGALVVYYDRATKIAHTINAREVAPLAATEDMFSKSHNESDRFASMFGWKSIAVPGELAGMWELHRRFGRLPWRDLFQPTIKLAREGMTVTSFFGRILAFSKKYLLVHGDRTSRELLFDPTTNSTFVVDDVIKMPILADTLETIANDPLGINEFYNGSIARKLVNDIQGGGGIVQLKDFEQYAARTDDPPLVTQLRGNLALYGLQPPAGSILLHHALKILDGFHYNTTWERLTVEERTLFYHRLVEALKFAFAIRGNLGDHAFSTALQQFVERVQDAGTSDAARAQINDSRTFDDEAYYGMENAAVENAGGTAHTSAMDQFGNAVSFTTSLNSVFGSYRISTSTGIILNDHMDDFVTQLNANTSSTYAAMPSSPFNKIVPGKRPMSSQCPLIIVDKEGNVLVVAGASGGARISSALLNVLTRVLYFDQNLKSAMDASRVHHQLRPNEIDYERKFDQVFIDALKEKGHKLKQNIAPKFVSHSAVEFIYNNVTDGRVYAVSDARKGGLPDGI